jgi:hypothetical protein
MKTALGLAALNLALFIAAASMISSTGLHHHWIFPALAALISAQWTLARGPGRARATLSSIMAFLLLMGLVRHATVLACFGRCSLKLAGAAGLAALVFALQSRSDGPPPWSKPRSEAAALSASSWGGYLALSGLGVPARALEASFLALGAALLLGGRRPHFRVVGAGVLLALGIRRIQTETPVVLLGLLLAAAGWAAAGSDRAHGADSARGPLPEK